MVEDDKRKFDIPWATLLPVIAALAGIVAQFKPLVSTRPTVPLEKSVEVLADQDVDARLWQDPLAIAQKEKAALDAQMTISHTAEGRWKRHQMDALTVRVRDSAARVQGKVLLLAVMLNAGPYIEQAESRLRARQAVLEGLSESGFVPVDGEHIGFVTAPWPPASETSANTPGGGTLLVPWEECQAIDEPKLGNERRTDRVFVLWLPAANFNPRPLGCFATLIEQFIPTPREKLDVKLIGPANSGGLQAMVREVRDWSLAPPDKKRDDLLDGVSIISPRATASDKALLGTSALQQLSVQQAIEKGVSGRARGGLRFLRTIATDDLLLRALIHELKWRGVHVTPWPKPKGRLPWQKQTEWLPGDRIAILTEWDNPYGRSLAATFESEARMSEGRSVADAGRLQPRIASYRYLHGIDGRLPGDPKENQQSDSQKQQGATASATMEATEGLNQSDFLRRLALQLKDQDANWRREEGTGIRAFGLLGSDIFDKLMILRALRPEFPTAIFFTDNFDAHFERRDDWDDTHNLVIASPFGSTLPEKWQRHIAPFRDNYQTSTYVGTLIATGEMTEKDLAEFLQSPRIFEISRKGAYELTERSSALTDVPSNRGDTYWFRHWLASDHVILKLTFGAVALLAMVLWISLSIVDRKLRGGGSLAQRLERVFANTAFWLICGVPVIIFAVAWFSQQGEAAREPLAFMAGISIWPSEMLRLIALLLAVHFMIKASVDLRANEHEINERFCLRSLERTGSRWGNLRLGLRRWQTAHVGWLSPNAQFTAEEAWHAYLRRDQFLPRFVRIAMLFLIYFVFAASTISLFGIIRPPARGSVAFGFDRLVLLFSVCGLMILTFYVVDAIQLNSNFIRVFTRGVSKWASDISHRSRRIPPLTEEELSRYHDIFFVAQRTEVVARLIWYPLIVLTLMFLARSSFFDNWTWPLSLILIFTLNAGWALGSAVFLRRAAEQLRASAINNLQLQRLSSFAIAEKRQMFDELIAEIRGLKKGAFAPLTEQPFIRAIVFPSGGLGLLAVGQRLLDIF